MMRRGAAATLAMQKKEKEKEHSQRQEHQEQEQQEPEPRRPVELADPTRQGYRFGQPALDWTGREQRRQHAHTLEHTHLPKKRPRSLGPNDADQLRPVNHALAPRRNAPAHGHQPTRQTAPCQSRPPIMQVSTGIWNGRSESLVRRGSKSRSFLLP